MRFIRFPKGNTSLKKYRTYAKYRIVVVELCEDQYLTYHIFICLQSQKSPKISKMEKLMFSTSLGHFDGLFNKETALSFQK